MKQPANHDSIHQFWYDVSNELSRAAADKKHPFRLMTLATLSETQEINQRTVVLRKYWPAERKIMLFTDYRTRKVEDAATNDQCSVLFYHPKKQLQCVVRGTISVEKDKNIQKAYARNIQGKAFRSYSSLLPPGAIIKNPEEAYQYPNDKLPAYFYIMYIIFNKAQVLSLGGGSHKRMRIKWENDILSADWLVP